MTKLEASNWIRFEGETYVVAPGERALDAMLRKGAPVNFSCRKGSCLSCMLQAVAGDPGDEARRRLPPKFQEMGLFLPCCTTEPRHVEAQRPDWSNFTYEGVVAERSELAPGVVRLLLEPTTEVVWKAGQAISLRNPDGVQRTYSVVSLPTDYFIELHIRVYPGGAVSPWAGALEPGQVVQFQPATGAFIYDPALSGRPLTLVGTGTGTGAVFGVMRDALEQGHEGPIRLFLGARDAAGLYLAEASRALAAEHPNLTVTAAASREAAFGLPPARVAELAFEGDMAGHAVFLCGAPDMVEVAHIAAVAHGVEQDLVFADPFDPPEPYAPDDQRKVRSLKPDPEIWAALEGGPRLTRILKEFYGLVYADPRLEPFFHRVTIERAIEKQYNFLRDIFSGTHDYFGEKPFNSHHWMVISDELFTYRENLFFAVVRKHDFPEPLIRRWAAMHELFRREIVKNAPRGHIMNGVEHYKEGYTEEEMGLDAVCDGCMGEIPAGTTIRMHRRTGEVFCPACSAG